MEISFCFFLISLFSFVIVCSGADMLTQGMSISGNQTLISADGTFALGFFSPGNSNNLYLGIWYNKIPEQTFVWVANRKNPVTKNFGGVLKLSNEGNLVILGGGKNVMWSSNILVSDVTIESPVAILMYTGNLILKNRNETVLWQSFDDPTDTLLPGMKVGFNLITGHNYNLTSWKDYENPEPGPYSCSLDHRGPIQVVIWNMSDIYARGDVWDGNAFIGAYVNYSKLALVFTIDVNDVETYATFRLSQDSLLSRVVLIPTGKLRLYTWDENFKLWLLWWYMPMDECDYYGQCGPFGICERDSSPPSCNCCPGFRPHSQKDWDMRNWSGGCVQHKELTCDERNEFLRLERVKPPDYSVMFRDLSMKECEMKCLRNCSCTAYTYVNSTSICLVWAGKLIDISDKRGHMDLYVRADETGLGNKFSMSSTRRSSSFINPRNWRIWVILVLCITLALVILGSIYYRWTGNKKKKETSTGLDLLSFDVAMDNKYLGNKKNVVNELQKGERRRADNLPLFTFMSIVAATDNFSAANKLGEGGFGPVHKGKLLNGQEVAVKRLSRMSGQGHEEFKNEITLIAKLQHRNLVRLLGCCIESEERILIYEYMPNKKLGFLTLWDLKASNILLDGEMNPKISDFGMARIFGGNNDVAADTKRVVGTYGYMAPEYAVQGLFSVKSDVFSFGVLLLEILSGKKNTVYDSSNSGNLLGYAWKLWRLGRGVEILDRHLGDSHPLHLLIRYIHVALLCVQENAADRPNMSKVLSMLSNELTVLPSPKRVAFTITQSSVGASSSPSTQYTASINDLTNSVIVPR